MITDLLGLSPMFLALAFAVTLFAGFVKGAVGFAMPTIMISGLASFLSAEVALAALILPTLVTNAAQALRGGLAAALATSRLHWRFIAIVLACIAVSAQFVPHLPREVLFLLIGGPVTIFGVLQLVGWTPQVVAARRRLVEVAVGVVAGLIGGVSGVWGPPTVTYLLALNTPKTEMMRVQGVVYFSGAVVLAVAHVKSGVLSAQTAPLSALLLAPALVGMAAGFWVQDRLDQQRFRQATLVVLILAGLNLLRRGLLG